jgi:hypothetical protein
MRPLMQQKLLLYKVYRRYFFLFIYGSIISFQEGLDFQLRQRAQGNALLLQNKYIHSLNYICHRRAAAAAEKNVFISLALHPRHNTKCARCNMASSPFYTHQLLFLYYIMPHHAYLYVQIYPLYYAAAHKEFLVRGCCF